ncbi:MAG TPA: hypothetical protein PKY05_15160 [Fibrobacteria bacterium]|nr:hypothetical protein [Fibrobacteria bacterium]
MIWSRSYGNWFMVGAETMLKEPVSRSVFWFHPGYPVQDFAISE